MPFTRPLLFIAALWGFLYTDAQQIVTGRVTTESGEPLAFATLYEEGTTNGTSSNPEGYYKLVLEQADSRIVCQYIGFARQIQAAQNGVLQFSLKPEALMLGEVVISAKARDPAYAIIRQAMKKRAYYQEEVEAFSCDVYIKGLQRLDKKPKSLLGMAINVDTGIVYLSESLSKYKFKRPDKISETMIASKYSGSSNGFSYNRASEMLINLYQNTFYIDGLSERSFISPIAGNAFLTYDYQLIGTFKEDTVTINKIRVTPKRMADPAFQGFIYIQENSWRIHSVDMMLVKENGIEFADSLKIFQVFAPTDQDIWMPLSQKFSYKFKAFGFEGSGVFTGVYSNYRVTPNMKVYKPKPEVVSKPIVTQKAEVTKKKEPAKEPKEFTNAILKIEEGSNEKDSIFWQTVRPVPLTPVEIKDYRVKDSIQVIRKSQTYLDSTDAKKNRPKVGNIFAVGYTHHSSFKERYYHFPNLLQLFQYNTIEGFVPEISVNFTQQRKEKTVYRVSPSVRYGFSNKRFQSQIEGFYVFDNKYNHLVVGGFGRYVYQFNSTKPIAEVANTFNTLALGENYIKLYQKAFAYGGYSKDLVNGLRIQTRLEYAQREQLSNTDSTTYSPKENFSSNQPENAEVPSTAFGTNNALTFRIRLRYTPGEKYIDRPDEKFRLGSKYPTFELIYQKGIPGLSQVNFDYVEGSMIKSQKAGIYGESFLHLTAGAFLNTSALTFVDFHHFNGNQIFVRQVEGDRHFQLLNYYTFSTKNQFLEAHYEHHFTSFILNKIPLVKKLKWQEVLSVNYLNTPALPHYLEFGVGIEHIFKFFRLDYYTSYNAIGRTQGFRFGAGF